MIEVISPADTLRNNFRQIPAYMDVSGYDFPIHIREVEVKQGLGLHDSILIHAEFGISDPEELANQPFSLRYGQTPNSNVFYGYFDRILKNQDLDSTIEIVAHGLGWTGALRRGHRRILEADSISDVVSAVLRPHGFRYVVDPVRFSSFREAQVTASDWEFLNYLATTLGLWVSGVNGTIWMFDPLAQLERGRALATFSRTGIDPQSERFLLDYNPGSESSGVEEYLGSIGFSYFNQQGQVVTRQPEDGSDSTNFYTEYIPNAEWADRVSRIIDYDEFHTATARVTGTAMLVPGVTCAFYTSRPEQRPVDRFDGLWMVSEVTHRIGVNYFQTSLGLVRDKPRMPRPDLPYEWPLTTYPGKLVPFRVSDDRWRL